MWCQRGAGRVNGGRKRRWQTRMSPACCASLTGCAKGWARPWLVSSAFLLAGVGPGSRDALEGKGHQRRPQQRSDRRLEEVVKAVGGGYCRLEMPLTLALGVRETVAGHRRGGAPSRG